MATRVLATQARSGEWLLTRKSMAEQQRTRRREAHCVSAYQLGFGEADTKQRTRAWPSCFAFSKRNFSSPCSRLSLATRLRVSCVQTGAQTN